MKVAFSKFLIWVYVKIRKNPKYTDEYIRKIIGKINKNNQRDNICEYIAHIFNENIDSVKLLFVLETN